MNLLHALFKIDQKNHYILFSSGSKKAQAQIPAFTADNVTHLHLNLPNKILNANLLLRNRPFLDVLIKEQLAKEGIFVSKPIYLFPNLNFISVSPKARYVLTLHDLAFLIFPQFSTPKSRYWHKVIGPKQLAGNAQTVIVPSKSTALDVRHFFNLFHEQIRVIPHGLPYGFNPRPEPQDHGIMSKHKLPKRFLLFVGDLDPRKNLSMVIQAVHNYREQTNDKISLVLAGKGKLKSKPSFVHAIGYVPDDHKPALYRHAQATLFPSLYEGFGFPILESMASGTPVITSPVSSLSEVGADAALYVNPYDANELTLALKGLLNDEVLQKRLIERGLKQVTLFDWEKTARTTLDIMEKIDKDSL